MAEAGAIAREGWRTLSNRLIGRLAACLWMLSGLLVITTAPLLSVTRGAPVPGLLSVGGTAIGVGAVVWFLPWGRWPRGASLVLMPTALSAIAWFSLVSRDNGTFSALFFLVTFVWLGLGHRRGMSFVFAPALALAYLLPPLLTHRLYGTWGLVSTLFVVFSCLITGETVAWVSSRLHRSEGALSEAEERFRAAFELAPIGIAMVTLDGRILHANRAFSEIVGWEANELTGVHMAEITHPDDLGVAAEEARALVAGEVEHFAAELRFVHRDGRPVWVSTSNACMRDGRGRPLYHLGQVQDVTERRELQDQLMHAAVHDQLTGLPNRVLFMDRLEMALQHARRSSRRVAVMFLDLDHFKLVNDSFGHDAGDRLLQSLAQRLQAVMRSSDTLARFGGDEFTVLCEVADEDDAVEVAERILGALAVPVALPDGEMFASASIGITLSVDGDRGAELLRRADMAMYRAKTAGPGHYELYRPGEEARSVGRLRTSNELHRAIDRDELELHYQPVVDLHTRSLVGLEALVRWRHPTRGLLFPAEFIPLAEEAGLIVPLGEWVLREAIGQATEWERLRTLDGRYDARLNVSVNVAAAQLADRGFPRRVAEAMTDGGIDPDRLWLEITESTLMSHGDAAVRVTRQLRALGLHLEIDDFGTGYSSLGYLKLFPVETLKVDRTFVREIDLNRDDVAIVRAVMALGEALGLSVIAEGVERLPQAARLATLGCFLAQGYLFGHPLPASALGPYPADDLAQWAGATAAPAVAEPAASEIPSPTPSLSR